MIFRFRNYGGMFCKKSLGWIDWIFSLDSISFMLPERRSRATTVFLILFLCDDTLYSRSSDCGSHMSSLPLARSPRDSKFSSRPIVMLLLSLLAMLLKAAVWRSWGDCCPKVNWLVDYGVIFLIWFLWRSSTPLSTCKIWFSTQELEFKRWEISQACSGDSFCLKPVGWAFYSGRPQLGDYRMTYCLSLNSLWKRFGVPYSPFRSFLASSRP